jgi:hypothetical protein
LIFLRNIIDGGSEIGRKIADHFSLGAELFPEKASISD